jgi:hypothetical protein
MRPEQIIRTGRRLAGQIRRTTPAVSSAARVHPLQKKPTMRGSKGLVIASTPLRECYIIVTCC